MKKKEIKKEGQKTVKKVKKQLAKLRLEDVLSEEQMKLYEVASPPRKIWLEYFVRTGDAHAATREAYPNCSDASMYQLTYRMRNHFGVSVSDLFRLMGIDELKIVQKTKLLLDAKRVTKRFKRGEFVDEVTEEDNFAISKGLDNSIKLLKIDPGQKLLHGEDPENRFQSVADLVRTVTQDKNVSNENKSDG